MDSNAKIEQLSVCHGSWSTKFGAFYAEKRPLSLTGSVRRPMGAELAHVAQIK